MRTVVIAFALLLMAGGCRTAEPAVQGEPVRSASAETAGGVPEASGAEIAVEDRAAALGAAPYASPAPEPPQRAPQGYALVYPGSHKVSAMDETTEGNGERNRIVRRTTSDSMDQVAAFFIENLGVQETLSLKDRKILTGPLPGGGRVAITLTRQAQTHIELVAVTPL